VDGARAGTARRASRWLAGSIALASVGIVAAPTQAATSRVPVDGARIVQRDGGPLATARVTWNADGVDAYNMTVGDLRVVAVSKRGHRPILLAKDSVDVDRRRVLDAALKVDRAALADVDEGDRIVLTVTQHAPIGQGTLTTRSYVTVAEIQPFDAPQPRIGSDDCSATPIVAGAPLNYCDLVGADLDGALVSVHDPKSDEGRRPSRSTRLQRADLTGATLVRADISGASIAGGRINGADLTRAKLDNLSLAGTEAVELIAVGASSDKKGEDSGANLFDTNLTRADLRETEFNGVSFAHATLNGARLGDARWQAALADGASFRGANLAGATLGPGSSVYFADFTDADLTGTDLDDLRLAWATLCDTTLPAGVPADRRRRDCRDGQEDATQPAPDPDRATPYVDVRSPTMSDGPGPRTIKATVAWDAASRAAGGYAMVSGDIRVVAVDGTTGRPTVIDTQAIGTLRADTTPYKATIDDPDKLAALRRGNRIVLTATQHPPFGRGGKLTERSYVTVSTLQKGPGRGRVGQYDCSRIAIVANSARLDGLTFCDLAGATLSTASLGARPMLDADLTGAAIDRGSLTAVKLDGAALGGLDADGATLTNVNLFQAFAPALSLADGAISGSSVQAVNLNDVDLSRTKLYNSSIFAAAPMRRATLSDAELDHTDLAYTDLVGAKLDGVRSRNHSSLFLSDLTGATLADSTWDVDESGELPWTWATLCRTTMPPAAGGISGDRDCRR
jgi:uncharacterized protein YjbI with pentapeptide repeats